MFARTIVIPLVVALAAGCTPEAKKEADKPKDAPPGTSASAAAPPQASAPAGPLYLASLDPTERRDLYHLPEGGELLPLDMLHAVESIRTFKPFMQDLERFRVIPDPSDPDGLPVGMSAATVDGKRSEPRMVFFNCAACHVSEITYQGKAMRVEGAPAHIDLAGMIAELVLSVESTLSNPEKSSAFLRRLAERRHPGAGSGALTKAFSDLKLPADKPDGALLSKVTEIVGRAKAQTQEGLAKAKAELDTAESAIQLLQSKLTYLQRLRGLRTTTFAGFGRLDAFMAARNLLFGAEFAVDVDSPVSLPPIYGLSKLTWYHYDNSTNSILQRDIGEDLGVGAVADMKTGESTVIVRNLNRLEQIAAKLPVPAWPEAILGKIDRERAARGAVIYKAECASCHDPDADGSFPDRTFDLATIGTDPNRAVNFAKPLGDKPFAGALASALDLVEKKAFEREGVTAAEAAKMEAEKPVWRATGKYASRPLGGVWASAPYLHNGSVPTLHDLLLPPEKRPKTFLTGSREYDPKKVGFVTEGSQGATFLLDTAQSGNRNTGHAYGTALSEEQRLDLLEHLKSL